MKCLFTVTVSNVSFSMQVEAADVVKIVLQFLKENSLTRSMQVLQEETHVTLNTVDNVDAFVADVQAGRWDAVMSVAATLKLPAPLLDDLYEQLVLEMIEMRELDTARQVLRATPAMAKLREKQPDRYAKLESLAGRPFFDPRDAYAEGSSKERRRSQIAEALRAEVEVVPPSRLLALLGQALKWQQHYGLLPADQKFDLFRGGAAQRVVEQESHVDAPGPVIKFGKKSHAECAAFSPDGQFFVSGSMDGFLEVWDYERGKVRTDLAYQEKDDYMMHDEPVLALAFSRDSELLASGSQDGHVKVWRVRTGQCVRRFPQAHAQGVTCLAFAKDGTQLASGSFDAVGRVHGLKSGKTLKELRGHTSYINALVYAPDGARLVTGSSDGSVRVWDAKSCDCLTSFRPPTPASGVELSINSLAFLPTNPDHLVVCNRSPTLYIMSLGGEVVNTLSGTEREASDFVMCAISSQGGWVHCVGEDSRLYSFDLASAKLAHALRAHDKDVIGLAIHPHRNLVATWADEPTLRLWKKG